MWIFSGVFTFRIFFLLLTQGIETIEDAGLRQVEKIQRSGCKVIVFSKESRRG